LSICSLAIGKLNATSDWQSALAADCETARRQFTAANYKLGIFWQILGGGKAFCPNFHNLARKVFCVTLANKFSPTKIMKTFFGVTSTKGLLVFFCKPFGRHFWATKLLFIGVQQ